MKNLFILFLTIVLVSCGNKDDTSKIKSTISSEFSPEKFVGSTIAYKLNDEIKLGIIEKKLITSFNKYSKKIELGKKALSYEIFKIEESGYIRFYNEDGSASTIALIESENKSQNRHYLMQVGETVCTTTNCANCCSCVPNGDYCTHCDLNSYDCKRTTSG